MTVLTVDKSYFVSNIPPNTINYGDERSLPSLGSLAVYNRTMFDIDLMVTLEIPQFHQVPTEANGWLQGMDKFIVHPSDNPVNLGLTRCRFMDNPYTAHFHVVARLSNTRSNTNVTQEPHLVQAVACVHLTTPNCDVELSVTPKSIQPIRSISLLRRLMPCSSRVAPEPLPPDLTFTSNLEHSSNPPDAAHWPTCLPDGFPRCTRLEMISLGRHDPAVVCHLNNGENLALDPPPVYKITRPSFNLFPYEQRARTIKAKNSTPGAFLDKLDRIREINRLRLHASFEKAKEERKKEKQKEREKENLIRRYYDLQMLMEDLSEEAEALRTYLLTIGESIPEIGPPLEENLHRLKPPTSEGEEEALRRSEREEVRWGKQPKQQIGRDEDEEDDQMLLDLQEEHPFGVTYPPYEKYVGNFPHCPNLPEDNEELQSYLNSFPNPRPVALTQPPKSQGNQDGVKKQGGSRTASGANAMPMSELLTLDKNGPKDVFIKLSDDSFAD